MNKLFLMCGLAIIGTSTTPEKSNAQRVKELSPLSTSMYSADVVTTNGTSLESVVNLLPWGSHPDMHNDTADLDLSSIDFIEADKETVDLGFDTALYLPANFDPYGDYLEVADVPYIEEDMPVDLGFDTAGYLPRDFDAYATPGDFMDISYIEEEDDANLGFDTKPYLPVGFNAYKTGLDLDSVVYIEEEEEVVLGFDTKDYLPVGFNPYSR